MKFNVPVPMAQLMENLAIDAESFWAQELDLAILSITKCVRCPHRHYCCGELQFCQKVCPNYQGFVS